ncbi:MAG: hypothetical protein H8E53_04870 [Planctomycetes bacterium]|nr:hypothetical protein [Planctomycetota bacterium]
MPVRSKYDAAQTTGNNRRHWALADALSANAANSPEIRAIIRARARYEMANNSWAKGMALTLAAAITSWIVPGNVLSNCMHSEISGTRCRPSRSLVVHKTLKAAQYVQLARPSIVT